MLLAQKAYLEKRQAKSRSNDLPLGMELISEQMAFFFWKVKPALKATLNRLNVTIPL